MWAPSGIDRHISCLYNEMETLFTASDPFIGSGAVDVVLEKGLSWIYYFNVIN